MKEYCPHGEDLELMFIEENMELIDCLDLDPDTEARIRDGFRARTRELIDYLMDDEE